MYKPVFGDPDFNYASSDELASAVKLFPTRFSESAHLIASRVFQEVIELPEAHVSA